MYNSKVGPIMLIDMLYGHRPPMAAANLYMSHRSVFTKIKLVETFRYLGFRSLVSARGETHFDLFLIASKKTQTV